MTAPHPNPHSQTHRRPGDTGQRYVITYIDRKAKRRRLAGYADTEQDAKALEDATNGHPNWTAANIRDRGAS